MTQVFSLSGFTNDTGILSLWLYKGYSNKKWLNKIQVSSRSGFTNETVIVSGFTNDTGIVSGFTNDTGIESLWLYK